MIVKEIYESVTATDPCRQEQFLLHLDTTVRALIAKYSLRYTLLPGTVYDRAMSVEEEIPVYEFYFPAIADNIRYLLSGNPDRKADYVSEAEDAYRSVWREKVKGTKFRSRDWYNYG